MVGECGIIALIIVEFTIGDIIGRINSTRHSMGGVTTKTERNTTYRGYVPRIASKIDGCQRPTVYKRLILDIHDRARDGNGC